MDDLVFAEGQKLREISTRLERRFPRKAPTFELFLIEASNVIRERDVCSIPSQVLSLTESNEAYSLV